MMEFNGLIFGHEREIKDIQIPRKDNWINYEVSAPQTKNMQDKKSSIDFVCLSMCLSGLSVKAQHSYQDSQYLKGQDYRKNNDAFTPRLLKSGSLMRETGKINYTLTRMQKKARVHENRASLISPRKDFLSKWLAFTYTKLVPSSFRERQSPALNPCFAAEEN